LALHNHGPVNQTYAEKLDPSHRSWLLGIFWFCIRMVFNPDTFRNKSACSRRIVPKPFLFLVRNLPNLNNLGNMADD